GCACSLAQAQSGDRLDKSRSRLSGFSHARLRDGGTLNPIRVEVDGVEVPFVVTGGADSQVDLYDNIHAGDTLFVAATHTSRTLDDFTFAGGQTAVVTGCRPSWATPAVITVPLTETVVVDFQFFSTLNPAVTPVNSGAGNTVRVTYANPAGGWVA